MSHSFEHSFEAGQRRVIPAVLVYIFHQDQILMIHRNTKNSGQVDYHEGKWNGLGGKLEIDESPLEAAKREIFEEAGIQLEDVQTKPLGVIQFPNFKPVKSEDWMVYVFIAEASDPQIPQIKSHCDEGDLHWVPAKDLTALNLWPGDQYFIPFVLERKAFIATIWYNETGQVQKHWMQPLTSNPAFSDL